MIDADKCRFINVALDDIDTTIAGSQYTFGPFGIVVRRRLQFQEEHPISDFEIEMDGVVVTINIVTVLPPTRRNFRNNIAEIYLNPRTQHACEGQIATRTATRSTLLTP